MVKSHVSLLRPFLRIANERVKCSIMYAMLKKINRYVNTITCTLSLKSFRHIIQYVSKQSYPFSKQNHNKTTTKTQQKRNKNKTSNLNKTFYKMIFWYLLKLSRPYKRGRLLLRFVQYKYIEHFDIS